MVKLRRRWRVLLILCCCCLYVPADALAARSRPRTSRPNILWVIAEDIGPDLSCYGRPLALSPNIDRLASQGVMYTRAYATAPVCSASRSALMTGMYQTTLNAQHHRSHRDRQSSAPYDFSLDDGLTLPKGVKLLTDRLRTAGYFTCNVVKFPTHVSLKGAGKRDWNFIYRGKPFDSDAWEDLKNHQPFYAQVNFFETHTPHKPARQPVDPANVILPPYVPDHPVIRQGWADYLGDIENLDNKVGRVLKLLEDDGLAENTVVFFFGDNGRELPRGKCTLFDMGIHIPLIVRWPGHLAPRTVSAGLVSGIDLAPTCLSLAGVQVPKSIQGQVFLGPNAKQREYVVGARDRIEEMVDRVRSVITSRYQYVRNFMPEQSHTQPCIAYDNPGSPFYYRSIAVLRQLYAQGKLTLAQGHLVAPRRPAEELYDLKSDPYELNNLTDSPEHQRILDELRSRLATWIRETKDRGEIPEDPRIVQRIEEFFRAWRDSDFPVMSVPSKLAPYPGRPNR